MGDESTSVPISDDPKTDSGAEAPKGDEAEPKVGYGWEAEIDETEFGESNDLEGQSPVEDNSPDPSESEEPPAPSAEPPPPAPPVSAAPSALPPPAPLAPPPPVAPRADNFPSLPHDDSPVVRQWSQSVLDAPVEQRQQLLSSAPSGVGEKVMERLLALDGAQRRLRTDPYGFVKELAAKIVEETMEQSAFAEQFRQVRGIVLGGAAEQFLAKHGIQAPTERQEFEALVKRFGSAEAAAEHLTLKRRLAKLEGTEQRVSAKERQIEATKASARAQQSGKGKSRATDLVGQRQKELDAAGTNPLKILAVNEKYEKLGLPAGRLKRTT